MFNQILQPLLPNVPQRESTFDYGNGIILYSKYDWFSKTRRWYDESGKEYTEQVIMKARN